MRGKREKKNYKENVDEKVDEAVKIKNKTLKNLRNLLIKVIFIIIAIYLTGKYCFGIYRMKGTAMVPSISDGDLIITYKLDKKFNRGTVIAYNENGKKSFSRIVAIEGDVVDISEDNELMINNHVENNKIYFETKSSESSNVKYPYQVKKGELFVVNDYRQDSVDSRFFGGISEEKVESVVFSIIRTKGI